MFCGSVRVCSFSDSNEAAQPSWVARVVRAGIVADGCRVALGAESKGVFCVAAGDTFWLSRDFGLLTAPDNYRRFVQALESAAGDLGLAADVVIRDLHPGYLSGELASTFGLPILEVQHHHAHVASCMAEHGITEPVIGIVCDGAGFGADRASWGCEVLLVRPESFDRVAHLAYFGLPGSDRAASQCWRSALSLAHNTYGASIPIDVLVRFDSVPSFDLRAASRMLSRRVQCPQTSSLGRLFDGVAFLLGLCETNVLEGQAARRLLGAAGDVVGHPWPVARREREGITELDFRPAIRELCERRVSGDSVEQLAADFHETVAAMLAVSAVEVAERNCVQTVALSGGCMVNQRLAGGLRERLKLAGLRVIEHDVIPCGDAGLALGQAYVAAARIRKQRACAWPSLAK